MLELTPEQEALFALLRNEKKSIAGDIDWDKVRLEAVKQSVFLLASDSLSLPEKVKREWSKESAKYAAGNLRSFHAITEMDRVMREGEYRYVILKGLAAAAYYPNYYNRILGDVDFLIDQKQRHFVEAALEAEGYKKWNTEHICHVVFRKEYQDLEMHFQIAGIPHGTQGEIVRQYMRDVLIHTLPYEVKGKVFELPLPKFHGLIMLLHMQHHMLAEGIGLRHLMDWCCFVDKTKDEIFWEKDLLPVLKQIGLLKYAQVMTKVGVIYLGTDEPDWCRDADESLCDEVMRDILSSGNFGMKNEARAASGMMIAYYGKDGANRSMIYNLWTTMLRGVRGYHPILKKYPVLYPVFILEFVAKRIYRVVIGERVSLYESSKYVDERKSVYDKLELFEV